MQYNMFLLYNKPFIKPVNFHLHHRVIHFHLNSDSVMIKNALIFVIFK